MNMGREEIDPGINSGMVNVEGAENRTTPEQYEQPIVKLDFEKIISDSQKKVEESVKKNAGFEGFGLRPDVIFLKNSIADTTAKIADQYRAYRASGLPKDKETYEGYEKLVKALVDAYKVSDKIIDAPLKTDGQNEDELMRQIDKLNNLLLRYENFEEDFSEILKSAQADKKKDEHLKFCKDMQDKLGNIDGIGTKSDKKPEAEEKKNDPVDNKKTPKTTKARNEFANQYAALLHAKERWFRGKNDKRLMGHGNAIQENYRNYVAGRLAAKNDADTLKDVCTELKDEYGAQTGRFQKTLTFMRKPAMAITRGAIGLGLLGAGVLTGGVGFIVAGGVVGAIGRFLSVQGIYDFAHHAGTATKKKENYGLAAQVFYTRPNNKFNKLANVQADKNTGGDVNEIAKNMDDNFIRYATRLKTHKAIKMGLSLVAAIATPFIGAWAVQQLLGGHEANAVTSGGAGKAAMVGTSKAALGDALKDGGKMNSLSKSPLLDSAQPDESAILNQTSTTPFKGIVSGSHLPGGAKPGIESIQKMLEQPWEHAYMVKPGQGIWHISKQIAKDKIPLFDNLSKADQNYVTDAIKRYVIANHEKVGLHTNEMIARSPKLGGPWLKKGADLAFTNDDLKDVMAGKAFAKRVAHILSTKSDLKLVPGTGAAGKAAKTLGITIPGKAAKTLPIL